MVVCKLAPSIEAKRDLRKRQTTRLVAGLISKARRLLHLLTRIFKVYIETLPGFSHVFSPEYLNSTLLSQGYIRDMVANIGIMADIYFKDERSKEPLIA